MRNLRGTAFVISEQQDWNAGLADSIGTSRSQSTSPGDRRRLDRRTASGRQPAFIAMNASSPVQPDPLSIIIDFLANIGLEVRRGPIPPQTFLPGIHIDHGALVIDEARLAHPGDLLHEAGHLAVMLPSDRAAATGNVTQEMGDEIAAQAWSFAAAHHLGLDPRVVFHAAGYHGASESLIAALSGPMGPGVPLLVWHGLTLIKDDGSGAAVFPQMNAWLRPPAPATTDIET